MSQKSQGVIKDRRRFEELDIARALPLLLLPVVHMYEEMESIDQITESFVTGNEWILKLCTLMPSVFMICLGANIVFSRKSTAQQLFKRGIHFIIFGVVLNFMRFGIPSLLYLPWTAGPLLECIYYTLTPDIYDFVGMAFLFFALFKKLKLSSLQILLISVGLLTLDAVIPNFETSNTYLNGFLGRFIWMDGDSCFPVLTWMIFPAIGYCFGEVYKRFRSEEDRKHFVTQILGVSVVGIVSVFVWMYTYQLDPILLATSPANDSITDLVNVVILSFEAGIWFAVIYFLYMKIRGSSFCNKIVHLSKRIVPFYVIQWVIIGWAEWGIGNSYTGEGRIFNTYTFWAASIATIIISIWGAMLLEKVKFSERSNLVINSNH